MKKYIVFYTGLSTNDDSRKFGNVIAEFDGFPSEGSVLEVVDADNPRLWDIQIIGITFIDNTASLKWKS